MSSLNNYIGYNLFCNPLDELPALPKITINTINQYSFCMAEKDPKFKEALQASDVLLPDGEGIVFALRSLTGQIIKKISGSDLHQYLLQNLNNKHGRCFYLGSSESTLNKIKNRLAKEYPNVSCSYYSPPFKADFSAEDNQLMIDKINAVTPDVVFLGMTAPKQEKWAYENISKLNTQIICSIGAVFDFYAGTVPRPSKMWIDWHLEWFIRLCKEPKRMWKRYLYYGPIFVYMMMKEKFKADLYKHPSAKA